MSHLAEEFFCHSITRLQIELAMLIVCQHGVRVWSPLPAYLLEFAMSTTDLHPRNNRDGSVKLTGVDCLCDSSVVILIG